MSKESGSSLKFVAFAQVFLILSLSFAFSFIVSENVAAQETLGPPASSGSTSYTGGVVVKEKGKGITSFLNNPARAGPEINAISGYSSVTEGSFITDGFGTEILIKDIGGSQTLANGNLQIIGKSGDVLGIVPSGNVAAFNSELASKGIDFVPKEKFEIFGTELASGGAAHLLQGVQWAILVAGGIQLIGGLFGLDSGITNAASIASIAGIITYKGLASLGPSGFEILDGGHFLLENAGFIGIGVGVVVFVLLYKEESRQLIQFQCLPWEAPLGGQNCDACNGGEFPCSEYRCRSLGQACDLVNEGTSEESCVWVSPDDVSSPIMTPWQEALTPGHSYTPDNAVNPPNRGVRIVNNQASNGCIAPFTPLEFGITTDEPSRCKIDYERQENLDDMEFFFGNSNLFRLNHTEMLRLPSPGALNGSSPILQNDGTFGLYVKCMDANGNENENDFVFNFCVDPSPDTTPPIIEDSSIADGSPVAFNSDEVDISVFVNEPAECKWSIEDKDYSEMENSMSCSTQIYQQNAQQLYECSGTLTGIQNNANNDFYFRCKDQPNSPDNERNTNTQSFVLNLLGSEPLNIIDFGPNETVTGSTGSVDVELFVETSNGANEGESTCYFSPSGDEGSYVAMFNTNSFEHSQTLSLGSGNYEYFFRCIDAGGNSDEASTQFNVFVDQSAPIVTRAYKEGADALKIVTNEDAQCVYSLNSCNYEFDEGINLIYSNTDVQNQHFAEWNTGSVYYVKCRDEFGNEPGPNQCSITVTASDLI